MNHASTEKISTQRMHQIVWSFIAVFTACAVTFPVAMMRVSQMDKFKGSHIKSWTERGTSIASVGRTAQ
jgi:hypothetical protein